MLLALVLAFAAVSSPGPVSQPSSSASPAPPSPGIPTSATEAVIVNSGSTNRGGYRLHVDASGSVALQQDGVPVKKQIPAALVKRFFADLKAAGPLDQLTTLHCMKSVSFGSTTQVGYGGAMSPDLSCASPSSAAQALAADAAALADAAGVSALPRMHRMRMPMPDATPAPSPSPS